MNSKIFMFFQVFPLLRGGKRPVSPRYGVVASDDYPMSFVFDFLDEMLEVATKEVDYSYQGHFFF